MGLMLAVEKYTIKETTISRYTPSLSFINRLIFFHTWDGDGRWKFYDGDCIGVLQDIEFVVHPGYGGGENYAILRRRLGAHQVQCAQVHLPLTHSDLNENNLHLNCLHLNVALSQ